LKPVFNEVAELRNVFWAAQRLHAGSCRGGGGSTALQFDRRYLINLTEARESPASWASW